MPEPRSALQHLFLPFQIVLLVVAGDTGVGDGFALEGCAVKQLWLEFGQVVAPMPAYSVQRSQFAVRFPAPECRY